MSRDSIIGESAGIGLKMQMKVFQDLDWTIYILRSKSSKLNMPEGVKALVKCEKPMK